MTPGIPWWQMAAKMGTGAAGGAQGKNPYGALGQAAGQFGTAIKDRINQRRTNHALQDSPGLQSGIDDALDTTPQSPVGAAPMADGQVVTRPTLAVIGEDRPEAVVPLGYRAGAKVRPSMAMPNKGRQYYGG